ncbi:MAG: hypothetical protein CL799_12035 [Chromatiales bacterium]|jgi:hypothetical protein|nr:hypothetical protein [Chromatiales bacterium]MDP7271337.1 hypothetical protein [Gammaproteobacteria bacterium]HJP04366.1 hypothetical protein [Gammaproteobacteria bacterium]
MTIYCNQNTKVAFFITVTLAVLVSCATVQQSGFTEFLPPPLNSEWERTEPVTGPADTQLFGGGTSTAADYSNVENGCSLRITMTGDAPMMQAFSMNFSNPAAAGLTGSQVAYAGDETIVITASGEVQTLTKNYLTQYAGDCDHETKLAYVAVTAFGELQTFRLPSTATRHKAPQVSTPGLQWDVAYGGPAKDWAYAMTGTYDGGLCTAGRTASQGAGLEDVWIVRIDGNGQLLWEKSFGGPAIDRGRAIVETPDHGLVIAGATESKGAGEFDVLVIKVDAEGKLVWDRHFGGSATDWASALTVTSDGGVALGAYTQDESGGPYDFWVIKLNGDGDLLWQRRYGGAETDWSNAITETADKGLVVVGHTESKGAGGADYWVLKLDASGEPLWDRTFGGEKTDYASAVTATRDGGVVVGGMTLSAGAGGFDIRILKLDSSGNVIWDQTLGGTSEDWVRAVVETRDGGYALAGYTMSQGAGLNDVWLVKLSDNGTLLWERTYGREANEWARALVELPDGGLALAGDTYSTGAGASDVLVLKISED